MRIFGIIILLLYIGTIQTSIYGNIKKSIQNFLQRDHRNDIEGQKSIKSSYFREKNDKTLDVKRAKQKAKVLQKAKKLEKDYKKKLSSTKVSDSEFNNRYFRLDPVINRIKRRHRAEQINARRVDDTSPSESSSLETKDWKDEFNEFWLKKKFEAINSTDLHGDVVNMVAARPWGVPCGDPNQQDLPWGNCMLSAECDAEYRIYRGDIFCGRTQFICCSLQLTNYDLYQGFDISFADSSLSTDSAEKKEKDRGSKYNKKRKKSKAKNKRIKERIKRKRKMKKNIRRIVHEIRKILNRSFRNASHHRKKRTLLLKKYIRDLKKQYKMDRKSVRDIHANDMEKVDEALEKRLVQVRDLNKNFLMNSTFRDIVLNGTISKTGARMLAAAYPELQRYLQGKLRRDGAELDGIETNELNDYLEYDIEYGTLYY